MRTHTDFKNITLQIASISSKMITCNSLSSPGTTQKEQERKSEQLKLIGD